MFLATVFPWLRSRRADAALPVSADQPHIEEEPARRGTDDEDEQSGRTVDRAPSYPYVGASEPEEEEAPDEPDPEDQEEDDIPEDERRDEDDDDEDEPGLVPVSGRPPRSGGAAVAAGFAFLEHPETKGREKMAHHLAPLIAKGRMTTEEAVELLRLAGRRVSLAEAMRGRDINPGLDNGDYVSPRQRVASDWNRAFQRAAQEQSATTAQSPRRDIVQA